jgi:hypothetical protein
MIWDCHCPNDTTKRVEKFCPQCGKKTTALRDVVQIKLFSYMQSEEHVCDVDDFLEWILQKVEERKK